MANIPSLAHLASKKTLPFLNPQKQNHFRGCCWGFRKDKVSKEEKLKLLPKRWF
jgi:hypothetical protein